MSYGLVVVVGTHEENKIMEMLWRHDINNLSEFKHFDITDNSLKLISQKFELSIEEISCMNTKIFNVLLNDVTYHYFIDKNNAECNEDTEEREEELLEIKSNPYFYKDENGKYHIYGYRHASSHLDSAELRTSVYFKGESPFLIKNESNIEHIEKLNKLYCFDSLVTEQGDWIELESREDFINRYKEMKNGTKMTIVSYHY